MRVISTLAQIDFQFGTVTRDGNVLVIESPADATMRSRVYVSPQDVIEFLKRLVLSPRAIVFVLGMPFFWYRWRRHGADGKTSATRKKTWPSV